MHSLFRALASAALAGACTLAQAGNCNDGEKPDGLLRAGGQGHCMALQTVMPSALKTAAPLFIVLHGDNGGKMTSPAYPRMAQRIAETFSAPAVFMLRPGYRGDFGKSDGASSFQDDDYTAKNVGYLAGAIAQLRGIYAGRKVVVVGHSGGAAMAALLISLHPQLVEGVVLAACPCNVQAWRQWRQQSARRGDGYWPRSLSPSDHVKSVPPQAWVVAVTGDQDANTLPQYAEEYIGALRSRGVQSAQFVLAQDADHASIRSAPELMEAIQQVVQGLHAEH